MQNMSGITPYEYNVVVKPVEIQERTAGGLILSEDTIEKEKAKSEHGTLIDVSPLAFQFEGERHGPNPGAEVHFVRYSGTEVTGADGETYRVMKDKDIIAEVRK